MKICLRTNYANERINFSAESVIEVGEETIPLKEALLLIDEGYAYDVELSESEQKKQLEAIREKKKKREAAEAAAQAAKDKAAAKGE